MSFCLDLPNASSILGQWLYNWQTLISGMMALVAAGYTVCQLKKQISQTDKMHQAELRRRHNAARAVVPITLAAISDFCSSAADQIGLAIEDRNANNFNAAFEAASSGRAEQKSFVPISLPNEVISTMKDFVETLSDDANVRHVAELLGSLQMLQARFKQFNLQQFSAVECLYGLLLDTAKVKLLTDSIYNYGRFVDENGFSIVKQQSIADAWRAIHGTAQGLVFSRQSPDLFFPKLDEMISSYSKNQVSPWNEKFS